MGSKGVSHLLLPVMLLLAATSGWGAEIHGRSSTQFTSFVNEFNDGRQNELGEYLRVGS